MSSADSYLMNPKRTFLRRRLFLPMGSATAVCLVLAYFFQSVDLLRSRLMFLGILLTVGYVDSVLRKHEEQRWQPAQQALHSRLESIANVTWSQFRTAFGLPADVIPVESMRQDDRARRTALIRVAEELVGPSAKAFIPQLDAAAWTKLATQLQIPGVLWIEC